MNGRGGYGVGCVAKEMEDFHALYRSDCPGGARALGFLAFHVGGGLIHALIVIAVIVLIFQLFSGRRGIA